MYSCIKKEELSIHGLLKTEIAGQQKSFGRKATVHVIVSLSEIHVTPENSAQVWLSTIIFI